MRRRVSILRAALAAVTLFAVPALAGLRPVGGNPADRITALPIDDYRYDHARGCHRKPAKGI